MIASSTQRRGNNDVLPAHDFRKLFNRTTLTILLLLLLSALIWWIAPIIQLRDFFPLRQPGCAGPSLGSSGHSG